MSVIRRHPLIWSCVLVVLLALLLWWWGGSSHPHEFIGWPVD